MKKMIIISLLGVFVLSCKKTDEATPTAPTPPTAFCKLTQMVTNAGTYDFTYNPATGDILKYVITSTYGTDKYVITYTFAYNAMGQPISGSQRGTVNGKTLGGGDETFTYTSGLLTGISFIQAGGTLVFATGTLTYDANKRLTQYVYKNSQTGYQSTNKYEYDAAGNCTRMLFSDTQGSTEELISTYDTSKNPEQIPAQHIPRLEFGSSLPWSVNIPITTKDTYDDGTGPVTVTGKRTTIKTDAKGYVISATFTDSDGKVTNESYTLSDCN